MAVVRVRGGRPRSSSLASSISVSPIHRAKAITAKIHRRMRGMKRRGEERPRPLSASAACLTEVREALLSRTKQFRSEVVEEEEETMPLRCHAECHCRRRNAPRNSSVATRKISFAPREPKENQSLLISILENAFIVSTVSTAPR